jgi:hypothetical protein
MDLFIEVWPCPIGKMLGRDDYQQFRADGIHGLMKEAGPALELLAIESAEPNKGYFRDFIKRAKTKYSRITLLCVWSRLLDSGVLARYGFSPDGNGNWTWVSP